MARLVLVNGAPGSGKSTVAGRLARDRPLDLALDIDIIKHSLGQWDVDPTAAGLQARSLALALVTAQLGTAHDVFLGQYLADPEFIEVLRQTALMQGAASSEIILMLDERTLTDRLAQRRANPERPEHAINSALVSLSDVPALIQSINAMTARRPNAIVIDASGRTEVTVELARQAVAANAG